MQRGLLLLIWRSKIKVAAKLLKNKLVHMWCDTDQTHFRSKWQACHSWTNWFLLIFKINLKVKVIGKFKVADVMPQFERDFLDITNWTQNNCISSNLPSYFGWFQGDRQHSCHGSAFQQWNERTQHSTSVQTVCNSDHLLGNIWNCLHNINSKSMQIIDHLI